ncbi:MAG: GEVED domain-containing protein [bacterium]
MKRSLKINIGFKALITVFVLMLFANVGAKSYCDFYTQYGWSGNYMAINLVKFEGEVIQKWDVPRDGNGDIMYYYTPNFNGYKDIDKNDKTIYVEKKKDYTMQVFGGAAYLYEDYNNTIDEYAMYACNYPQDYKVYIDFNQDGEFDESSELAGQWDDNGSYCEAEFTISIPSDAKSGQTRMRIVNDYYGMGGGYMDACNSYYGEAKDYLVEIKAGFDIGISQITAPANPLVAGNQEVRAILHNYTDAGNDAITSCTINWEVDGVSQGTVYWYGWLDSGSEEEVVLGNYDFTSKGVLTTYTLSAKTDYPNYADDGNVNNDKSPAFVAAMPIVPGIYTVGGSGYDFETVKIATDIINNAGISGDGDLIFKIRPGTYKGPFTMDNFPRGNNNFVFENDPATQGDVIISAVTNSSNYVWSINNISNVTFQNLIFEVTNGGSGARIMKITGDANNYTFDNNTFNGTNMIDQTPYKYCIIDCQASQMNNHSYTNNSFNNGSMSLVLLNASRNSSGLLIDQNTFNAFTNRAIQVEGISNGVISKNTMKATATPSYGGIIVTNGTTIINNTIAGLAGISTSASAISEVHTGITESAYINGNRIMACKNINGISVNGISGGEINNNTIDLNNTNLKSAISGIVSTNLTLGTEKIIVSENSIKVDNGHALNINNSTIDILKNIINTDNSASQVNLKTISATKSTGMMLLNEVISTGEVMEIDNSSFTIAYNSTVTVGSADVLIVKNGDNQIYRNQLINNGTGNAFAITGLNTNVMDGNNYFTTTGILGTIDGTIYTSTSDLLTIDKTARNVDPTYKTNSNLKITTFQDELVFKTPIENVNWPEGYQANYEERTLDNVSKNGFYYVGAYIVFPNLEIIGFTDELIDCAGTPDRSISVSAATSNGQEPTYQWYKDGLPLPGETTHILSFEPFDYTVSATYTCRVYCAGAGAQLTGTIPVYALTLPSIVEQPKEVVNAVIGKDYSFNVRVHYRGILPPYYKDNFQWFKYDAAKKDSLPLVDDSRLAGTGSSDLTITKLKDADICKPGDFYYIRIISECGTVYSDPFVIAKTPEVVFRDHPANTNPCPNADVIFVANAIAPEGFNLTYKWMKDGVDLTNGIKYNGANTNKLQVFGVQLSDEGNYVCVATIPEVPTSKNSSVGILKLKDIPTATAEGQTEITTKRGNNITLHVNFVKGSEPLTVKWTYNGELIKEALWSQYDGEKLLTVLLENVIESQSGEYKCVLENECDKTEIVYNITITKWDEAGSVEVISENGYSLYNCAPNPSNGSTKIKFEMAKTDNAVINLIDQSGRTVSELFNGVANKGMNILDVNTNRLNVSAGMYFYTITTNGFSASMPMVIVK